MKYIILILIPLFVMAETSFISAKEYSAQLYKNPRGIGCHHCHGEKGEGKLVAKYIHKKEKKSFEGPSINKMEFQIFYRSLNERKKGMPRYYLTTKEIEALYLHIQIDEIEEKNETVTKKDDFK